MKLTVNGELREVPDGLTVAQLLKHLDLSVTRIAVELNAEIVRRAQHEKRTLAEGDQLEIVTFVGGG
jgi:sulfur carrier protein